MILNACTVTQRSDLFFGMEIPGGGHVSTEQWKNFSDSVIAKHFPEGSTEFDAKGKWFDPEKRRTISEDSKVVSFIGEKSKVRDRSLDTIMRTYAQKFNQQAVMRVDSRLKRVMFVGDGW